MLGTDDPLFRLLVDLCGVLAVVIPLGNWLYRRFLHEKAFNFGIRLSKKSIGKIIDEANWLHEAYASDRKFLLATTMILSERIRAGVLMTIGMFCFVFANILPNLKEISSPDQFIFMGAMLSKIVSYFLNFAASSFLLIMGGIATFLSGNVLDETRRKMMGLRFPERFFRISQDRLNASVGGLINKNALEEGREELDNLRKKFEDMYKNKSNNELNNEFCNMLK